MHNFRHLGGHKRAINKEAKWAEKILLTFSDAEFIERCPSSSVDKCLNCQMTKKTDSARPVKIYCNSGNINIFCSDDCLQKYCAKKSS